MPSKAGTNATTSIASTAVTSHQSKVMFKTTPADSAAATRASLAASIAASVAAAAVAGKVAVQKLIVLLHMVQCSEQTGRWSALPTLHRDALQVLTLS
jgi:hypothetical protein